jgi:hypothetical protein
MNGEFDNLQVNGPFVSKDDGKMFNCMILGGGASPIAGFDEGGEGSARQFHLVGETTNDRIASFSVIGSKLCALYNDNGTARYTVLADLSQGSTVSP